MSDWYKDEVDQVLRHVRTDKTTGLEEAEARLRFDQHGPNQLVEKTARKWWPLFLSQFSSTVVLVLLASTAVSSALGDIKNAFTIGAIVLINAFIGFTQEHRAEQALAALRKLTVPRIKVRRDGRILEVSAVQAVPGDMIVLEAGSAVPADGRIVESFNLRVQESALTGEAESIEKSCRALGPRDRPVAERSNMVYAGTVVTFGRGLMVVTETGMTTELGRIAAMIQSVPQDPTPLQKRLDQLGSRLAFVALGIVSVIFVLGLLRGEDFKLMFLTAVSIAVAAIPEGLPAIVTINLAFGAQRLLKQHALIRQLPAVETLGSVTVICTDKTGTLTENKMAVVLLDVANHRVNLGDRPMEAFKPAEVFHRLLQGAALCNDAVVDGESAIGDPTETALALAAARGGFDKSQLEQMYPRVGELPFDPSRKRMSTVHKTPDGHQIFTKGSVDSLLSICSSVFVEGEIKNLDHTWKKRIHESQNSFAQSGMRVMGVAFRSVDSQHYPAVVAQNRLEEDLIFVGLIGLKDPLRQQAKSAVETCVSAGIKTVMITGDHPLTAQSIANELGFTGKRLLSGPELDNLSMEELESMVDKTSVYARVAPEHKLNIVQAFQNRGHVVAMTGDGVNDAPALKKADIGVAMGITGTDVAKESADMVLLDDNFATIVAAVKEGRVIYENIRKFLLYLLTGNVGEMVVMFVAPFLGMPMALLPVQILWMNLITDGLPALALGIEPAERDVMRRSPISPNENIFGRGMGAQIVRMGLVVGFIPLAVGAWYWRNNSPVWQTMVFTTLIFLHVVMSLAFRSQNESFFQISPWSNKPLLAAVGLSIALQLAVVYLPFLQTFFNTASLSFRDLIVCFVLGSSVFWMAEIEKWIGRRSFR